MPQLGLGLGLHKSSPLQSPLQQLVKASSWSINMGKATGTSPGINSPFTNPVIDLSGAVGKNKLDLNGALTSQYVNFTNGTVSSIASWTATQFVDIEPLTQYTLTGTLGGGTVIGHAFYDVNKQYISGVQHTTSPQTFTTPSNARYARFSLGTATVATAQLELGSTATAYEPYGKANVLLTNFGATTSSGYVVESNAGKTFTMLKFDGTDDYGLASNLASLDITGTGDFAIACVFKTSTFNIGMILSKALNDSPTNAQYALFTINDTLYLRLGGQTYPFGSVISANTLYKCIVYRNSGVLKCKLNGVQIFSASNNVDVVSQPSFLVGAESNGLGGATTFTNIALGHLSIINGAIDPFTEAKLIADWDRFCASTYGL